MVSQCSIWRLFALGDLAVEAVERAGQGAHDDGFDIPETLASEVVHTHET